MAKCTQSLPPGGPQLVRAPQVVQGVPLQSPAVGNRNCLRPPSQERSPLHTWVFREHLRRGRPRWGSPLSECRSLWQACNSCSCMTLCECPPGRPWPWLPWMRIWEQSWHQKPLDEASVGCRRRLQWQVWELWTTDCNGWWTLRAQHLIYAHSRWIPPRNFHQPQQIKSCEHACTSASHGLRLYDHGVWTQTITEGCATMLLYLIAISQPCQIFCMARVETLPCGSAGSHLVCGLVVANSSSIKIFGSWILQHDHSSGVLGKYRMLICYKFFEHIRVWQLKVITLQSHIYVMENVT